MTPADDETWCGLGAWSLDELIAKCRALKGTDVERFVVGFHGYLVRKVPLKVGPVTYNQTQTYTWVRIRGRGSMAAWNRVVRELGFGPDAEVGYDFVIDK